MENNATIVRHFIETVLNNGDIEATGQYFHEDVIELAPFPGQGPGLSGLKEVLGGLRTVYPDMHWTIGEQVSEGDGEQDHGSVLALHRDDGRHPRRQERRIER